MGISEFETLWKEKKSEVKRESIRKFITRSVVCFFVISCVMNGMFSQAVEANKLLLLIFFLPVLLGSFFVIFVLEPDFLCVSYGVKKEFLVSNKDHFYEPEVDICEFEVIEMKSTTKTFELLLKSAQDDVLKVSVPFSRVKLKSDIGKVKTGVRHTLVLRDLPFMSDFEFARAMLMSEAEQVRWILM